MNKVDTIFWCLCIAIMYQTLTRANHTAKDSSNALRIDISRGIAVYVTNNETTVKLSMSSLIKRDDPEERNFGIIRLKKRIIKGIGMAMMMVPLMMQLAWLPVTLSSIKLSLIRSLFVGKIALAIMLYNTLRNSKKSETIVIHKPEYHQHYYETYHEPEADDDGWWGRRTRWHFFK
ncbi:uncharacterized protein LOC107999847 [Apis cerana]|uniref:uncharacterized protein LOC107999847 n=1 Tax=Apis cerana TaxID=7461 RepID=UPI0007E2A9F2|nr:uncharacterized protein LOC107999847 [Apis cerana]